MYRTVGPLPYGALVVGLFTWEVLARKNLKRWQIWSVLPAAGFWIGLGILNLGGYFPLFRAPDPSWWIIVDNILCPLSLLPYLIFRVSENFNRP